MSGVRITAADLPINDDAIARREAEVIGDGPRIEPLDPVSFREDALEFSRTMMRSADGRLPVDDLADVPEYVPTLIRHRELFERQLSIGLFLLANGSLPPRERELAILRVAWLCQAPYEWGEHVFMAHRIGLNSDEIERIRIGASAPAWQPLERAVLQAVDELLSNAMISDVTWAVLAAHWDEKQLIEFPVVVGQYQSTAYLQNSLRMRLHPGNKGLRAR